MSGSFVVSGQNVMIRFEYTASISKAQETVFACAKSVYGQHPIYEEIPDDKGNMARMIVPFEQLTAQQKLAVVDAWILDEVIMRAKKQYQTEALGAAMGTITETIRDEADEKFI